MWCVLVVSVLAEVVETTRSLEPQLTPCRRRAWQSRMHRLDPTAGHVKNDCKPTELLYPITESKRSLCHCLSIQPQ